MRSDGKVGPRKVDGQGRSKGRAWHDSNTPQNEKQETLPTAQNLPLRRRAKASPVCLPEHVPLSLGMDVLDDGGHVFPRFLGKVREVKVITRPETALQTPEGSN